MRQTGRARQRERKRERESHGERRADRTRDNEAERKNKRNNERTRERQRQRTQNSTKLNTQVPEPRIQQTGELATKGRLQQDAVQELANQTPEQPWPLYLATLSGACQNPGILGALSRRGFGPSAHKPLNKHQKTKTWLSSSSKMVEPPHS